MLLGFDVPWLVLLVHHRSISYLFHLAFHALSADERQPRFFKSFPPASLIQLRRKWTFPWFDGCAVSRKIYFSPT